MNAARRLSVVVPAFNEAASLPALVDRVTRVLATLPYEPELIVVDDGSSDDTPAVLEGLAAQHPCLGVVQFSRNFGHQAALTAGLDYATGDAVVVMDADLQHPPEAIPDLVRRWEEGFDIVQAGRDADAPRGLVKRVTSAGFYRVLNSMSDVPIEPDAPDFRLLDRTVVDALKGLRERTRFLRGLMSWVGFRRAHVTYREGERLHGQAKFTMRRMVRLAADGVVAMSTAPLRAGLWLGLASLWAGILYAAWLLYVRLSTHEPVGTAAMVIDALALVGGLQLIVIGILGTYLGRVLDEVRQRPIYVVRRRSGKLAS